MKIKKLKRYDTEMEKILFDAFDMLSNAGFDVDVYEQGYMSIVSSEYSIEFDLAEGIVLIPDNEKDSRRFGKRQEELSGVQLGLIPMHI